MTTVTFDTHKFIRKLTASGLPPEQAEAISEAFQDAQNEGQPVTRDYFDARLKAEIETAKADLIKWMAGLLLAQAAVVATLVKLL